MNNPINGKAIKLGRQSRNMTQSELAKLTGICNGTMCKIEKNFVRLKKDKIAIICEVLQYPESFFRQDPVVIYSPVSVVGGSSYTKYIIDDLQNEVI